MLTQNHTHSESHAGRFLEDMEVTDLIGAVNGLVKELGKAHNAAIDEYNKLTMIAETSEGITREITSELAARALGHAYGLTVAIAVAKDHAQQIIAFVAAE